MSSFLDRYLPGSERRAALWLALGGAGVFSTVSVVGSLVFSAIPGVPGSAEMPTWAFALIMGLAAFAVVALIVAALIRFAWAPKALALYVMLVATVAFIAGLGGPAASVAQDAGMILGALGGAWIATTVSLARIRDAGFSGDEPNGRGLSTTPQPITGAFLGWEGRPAEGDSKIAIALAATAVIPAIAERLLHLGLTLLISMGGASVVAPWVGGSWVVTVIAWGLSAYVVTLRTGVRSSWVGAAKVLAATVGALVFIAQGTAQGVFESAVTLVEVVGYPCAAGASALLGTHLAFRRGPATLSPNDPQDPASPETPPDTAGDTDE